MRYERELRLRLPNGSGMHLAGSLKICRSLMTWQHVWRPFAVGCKCCLVPTNIVGEVYRDRGMPPVHVWVSYKTYKTLMAITHYSVCREPVRSVLG